jgi:hypothetical protein
MLYCAVQTEHQGLSAVQDFYNLELSDTNVVDHNTHDYRKDGIEFLVVDEAN